MVYYITTDMQILIFFFLLLTSIYSVTINYISYNFIIFVDNLFKMSGVTKEGYQFEYRDKKCSSSC